MVTYKGTAQRSRHKKVPTDDGRGFKVIADGIEMGDITLEIDVAAISRRLGEKALASRGKRSRALGGLIVVRASNVRRAP